jgi:hypothetical protein
MLINFATEGLMGVEGRTVALLPFGSQHSQDMTEVNFMETY